MALCPECNGPLTVPVSIHLLTATGRQPLEPVGAWCRSNAHCDYGAISEDDPETPHPMLPQMRFRRVNAAAFHEYVLRLARIIPEVEIDPQRCGGRPSFTNSRLPLEVIVGLLVEGTPDEEILAGYPRMTKFLLTIIRQALLSSVPPIYV